MNSIGRSATLWAGGGATGYESRTACVVGALVKHSLFRKHTKSRAGQARCPRATTTVFFRESLVHKRNSACRHRAVT
jgi:hypothetical protein